MAGGCASTISTRARPRPPTANPSAAAARCCSCTASRRGRYLYRHMIPVLTGAGLPVHRARPRRASAAPTSRPSAPTTPTSATSTGCARALFDELDLSRPHARVPGLGRAHRAAAASPSTPTGSPRVVAANTFLPTGDRDPGRGVPSAGAKFSQTRRDVPDRLHRQQRLHHRPRRRGGRGVRRAVPRRDVQGRRAAVPDCSCRPAPDDPAAAANRAAWERAARSSTSPSCARSATPTRSPAATDAYLQRRDPRRGRPAAHDDRRWRPLHPGGPGCGARRGDRVVARGHDREPTTSRAGHVRARRPRRDDHVQPSRTAERDQRTDARRAQRGVADVPRRRRRMGRDRHRRGPRVLRGRRHA